MLKPLDIDALVCGHTHKPYHRVVDGIHVINDGSVGKPKDGDAKACYALIRVDEEIGIEFRRVEYPARRVADDIKEAGLPAAFADVLLTGGAYRSLHLTA
jgi:diadenosine tetraphosphatase ApaH/serine/threonine PP2A family protein phosphatase